MTARIEDCGHYLVVHNRTEKRGALTPAFYDCICDAIAMAEARQLRCVIVTGGPFFCAGGDLSALKTRAALPIDERRAKIDLLHDVIRAMKGSQVPLIAAIEGGAAGAGLSLALACDLIVAARDASFAAAYVKAGLTPDGGLTHALATAVPKQFAMEMCLLGRAVSAERFADLGVVSQICEPGKALDNARTIANDLARGPRQAQSAIRQLIYHATDNDLTAQLDLEADMMAIAQGSPDAAEGIAAFLDKRAAEFGT